MPEVYETTSACDGRTDYVIWGSRQSAGERGRDVPVEMLGVDAAAGGGADSKSPGAAPDRAVHAEAVPC